MFSVGRMFIFLPLLCLLAASSNDIDGLTDVELSVPGGNEMVSYFLYANHSFTFVNQMAQTAGLRYFGSQGFWRVEDGNLEIRVDRHYFFRDRPKRVNTPASMYDYGSDNPVHWTSASRKWQAVGSISGYQQAYKAYAAGRDRHLPTLALRLIEVSGLGATLTFEFERPLSEMTQNERDIMNDLRTSVEGKPGEWPPE